LKNEEGHMNDIEELQRRITAAMDQVAFGVDKLGAASAGPDEDTLRQLEDERTANAQLQERVRSLRTKSEGELAALRSHVEEGEARMAQLDIELQRVRRANAQLTDACAALRDANTEGVGEPHLINKAMLAELEGLRAARAADVAETSTILASLQPLIDAASDTNAPQEDA
jgi:predicted  nucleic acid-binding Zn-ribbon protein